MSDERCLVVVPSAEPYSTSLPSSSAGFGLGALNDAEDDDVDVYDFASRADRTYMPYDSTRDADESTSVNENKATHKVMTVSIGCISILYAPGTNYR